MTEQVKEYRCFGPPGTGKTTWLSKQVHNAAKKKGSSNVIVSSFTKSAAEELVSRKLPVPKAMVGTLHSHCYQMLDCPDLANAPEAIDDWNKNHPNLSLSKDKNVSVDDGGVENTAGTTDGDMLYQQMEIYRAKMIKPEVWPERVKRFRDKWEEWKNANRLNDFTDLVELPLKFMPPEEFIQGRNLVGFFDEVQDFTPLELSLVRHWGSEMEYIIFSGDDDQASMPYSKVLVQGGEYKRVDELIPGKDKLVSYDKSHSELKGLRKGYDFEIKPTYYKDDAVSVIADDKRTDTTHNHIWNVRWSEKAKEKCIVYLMKKEFSFRVGWCKLIRSDNICHFFDRARREGAEAGWILKICDSKKEASKWESMVNAYFGISTVMFDTVHEQYIYDSQTIQEIFDFLGDNTERAIRCLRYFNKSIDYPFWRKNQENRHGRLTMTLRACNLFPEIMKVPVVKELKSKKVEWEVIENIERFYYEGYVYGFRVEPYKMYVADGIVTHNCIYGFKGTSPEGFLQPDIPQDNKIVLSQSYRIPRKIQKYAEKWISQVEVREQKEYSPREEEGTLKKVKASWKNPDTLLRHAEKHLEEDKTVMILATCSYMLEPIKGELKKAGIKFHNPYRRSRGDWNPLNPAKGVSATDRIMAYMIGSPEVNDEPRLWTLSEVQRWTAVLKSKGILKSGAKSRLQSLNPDKMDKLERTGFYRELTVSDLLDYFEEEAIDEALQFDLDWYYQNIVESRKNSFKFPYKIAKQHGPHELRKEPNVIIGTIHSVKGGEADVVYLFPDLSVSGMREWKDKKHRDNIIRQFYVGITRARESLYLCSPATPYYVRW